MSEDEETTPDGVEYSTIEPSPDGVQAMQRTNCFELVGVPDADPEPGNLLRLQPDLDQDEDPVAQAIWKVCKKLDDIRIEMLLIDDGSRLRHIIKPYPIAVSDTSSIQTTIDSYEALSADLLDRVEEIFNQELGDNVRTYRCEVSFESLGNERPVTTRVVSKKHEEVAPRDNTAHHPMSQVLARLVAKDVPFIGQILFEHTDGTDTLNVRVAIFDDGTGNEDDTSYYPADDETVDAIASDGGTYPHDLYDILTRIGVTTNHQFPASKYHRNFSMGEPFMAAENYAIAEARAARQIITGVRDFDRLLRGTPGRSRLNDHMDRFPRIQLSSTKLSHFTGLYVYRFPENRWANLPVNGPHIRRTSSTFDDTPLSTIADRADTFPTQEDPGNAAFGNPSHEAGLEAALEELVDRGILIFAVRIDQNEYQTPVPDAIGLKPDGTIVIIEYETPNRSPTNYLNNVAVFLEWDRRTDRELELYLIAGKKLTTGHRESVPKSPREFAATIESNLAQPFNELTADGARLYIQNQPVSCTGAGGEPLLTEGCERTTWILTDDGQLECRADGDTIACGPAEDNIATFSFESPQLTREGDSCQVVTPDGDVYTYDSRDGWKTDWSRVKYPHVPVRLSYAGRCTIFQMERSLTRYESDLTDPSDSKWYNTPLQAFADTHLYTSDEAFLPNDHLETAWETYITPRIDDEYDLPGKDWIVRKCRAHIGREETDTETRYGVNEPGDRTRGIANLGLACPPTLNPATRPNADMDTISDLIDTLEEAD